MADLHPARPGAAAGDKYTVITSRGNYEFVRAADAAWARRLTSDRLDQRVAAGDERVCAVFAGWRTPEEERRRWIP